MNSKNTIRVRCPNNNRKAAVLRTPRLNAGKTVQDVEITGNCSLCGKEHTKRKPNNGEVEIVRGLMDRRARDRAKRAKKKSAAAPAQFAGGEQIPQGTFHEEPPSAHETM